MRRRTSCRIQVSLRHSTVTFHFGDPSSAFISDYIGAGNYVGKLHDSNIWEYRGEIFETHGRHTFRIGASQATDGWEQPFYGSENDFEATQTADGNGNGGDALASTMLGVPNYAEVDNVYSLLHGGKIIGTYFQDQWRVNDKLTINWGRAARHYGQSAPGQSIQRQRHHR